MEGLLPGGGRAVPSEKSLKPSCEHRHRDPRAWTGYTPAGPSSALQSSGTPHSRGFTGSLESKQNRVSCGLCHEGAPSVVAET